MTLTLTEETPPEDFERLTFARDEASGLAAYICIHSTLCGPAAGGCRMWNYASRAEAREDVLRLARGMTAKTALAGLGLGGGKSVIIGDPRTDKSPTLLRAFGTAVEHLRGRYFTAEDVGISPEDMAIVAQETAYAVGLEGGTTGSGDPSPFTAEGVFRCLKVGAEAAFGNADLAGRRVLVQGLGHVGMALAQKLHAAGASLIVADLNETACGEARARFDAEVCAVSDIMDVPMDIFAPCALGGVLTREAAGMIPARLICGAANNQLAEDAVADVLNARGVRYLPDYVVNAGGIISVASEIHGAGDAYRQARLGDIERRMRDILAMAETTGETTTAVARALVDRILSERRRTLSEVTA
ncbi:MAG: Glu/Leu/Phe/Val dehydrogenase dimerization domain-containing protein [Pseudomonadota bacterium]